jgi:hypothetical protein
MSTGATGVGDGGNLGAGLGVSASTASDRPRVARTASSLIWAGTVLLPAGALRDRYRREHRAELSTLAAGAQLRYALGAFATCQALRLALTSESDMSTSTTPVHRPLLCRLGYHHWRVERNPDGDRYRRCTKCSKDDSGSSNPRGVDDFSAAMSVTNFGGF